MGVVMIEILIFAIGGGVGWIITSEYMAEKHTQQLRTLQRRLTVAEFKERHR